MALRAWPTTWAAHAATPAKTTPIAATEAPYSTDSRTGCCSARNESVTPAPTATEAADATSTAAVITACGETTVEPRSSTRPESSSARVWRTTAKTAIRATPSRAVMLVS